MINVALAMSSYNGEKYIEEQIESIMNQSDVYTILYIRDDGSKDNTIQIIKGLQTKYKERIHLYEGNNIGFQKSFLIALSMTGDADFYGFADQDDFWFPKKCSAAVKMLKDPKLLLYSSSQIYTNENLKPIGIKDFSNMDTSIECTFARNRLPGCTFLFKKEVKDKSIFFLKKIDEMYRKPSHDFITLCCALATGEIYIDRRPYMYYRRINSSLTPIGNGLRKRLKNEFDYVFHRKYIYSSVANILVNEFSNEISDNKLFFLRHVRNSRYSIKSKLWLISNSKFSCGFLVGDFETKTKVLLGYF